MSNLAPEEFVEVLIDPIGSRSDKANRISKSTIARRARQDVKRIVSIKLAKEDREDRAKSRNSEGDADA